MKGLLYFGYAVAIVGVVFAIADALRDLFAAWRDGAAAARARNVDACPTCSAPLETWNTDFGPVLLCPGCGWEDGEDA